MIKIYKGRNEIFKIVIVSVKFWCGRIFASYSLKTNFGKTHIWGKKAKNNFRSNNFRFFCFKYIKDTFFYIFYLNLLLPFIFKNTKFLDSWLIKIVLYLIFRNINRLCCITIRFFSKKLEVIQNISLSY